MSISRCTVVFLGYVYCVDEWVAMKELKPFQGGHFLIKVSVAYGFPYWEEIFTEARFALPSSLPGIQLYLCLVTSQPMSCGLFKHRAEKEILIQVHV